MEASKVMNRVSGKKVSEIKVSWSTYDNLSAEYGLKKRPKNHDIIFFNVDLFGKDKVTVSAFRTISDEEMIFN